MDLLIKNIPTGYETGDMVTSYPDETDYTGSQESNASKFTIVTGVTLSEANKELLLMNDDSLNGHAAISKLPTFRSMSTQQAWLKLLHKRKYQYVDGLVKLKSNAQVSG